MSPLEEDEIFEFSKAIDNSGNQLLEIIQDMLDLSVLEGEKIKFRKNEFVLQTIFDELPESIKRFQKKENKQHLEVKFNLSIKQ